MADGALTLLKATPGQLVYQVVGDGTGGVQVRTQAQLAADCANGPLKDMLTAPLPTADQANARAKFLGQGVSSSGVAGKWESCAEPVCVTRDTEANVAGIDADVDGATITKGRYMFDIPAVAGVYTFYINFRHSILG